MMGTLRAKTAGLIANEGSYKAFRITLALLALAGLVVAGVAEEPVVWPG